MSFTCDRLVGLVCTIPNFSRRRRGRNLGRNVVIKEAISEPSGIRIVYADVGPERTTFGWVTRKVAEDSGIVLGVYPPVNRVTEAETELGLLYMQRQRTKAAGVVNGI